MKIIDTHSHIYLEEFDSDRADVILRAKQRGVDKIILPAIDLLTLDRLVKTCDENAGYCYPLIGLHPEEVHHDFQDVLKKMEEILKSKKYPFVGVGEIGLDFYWDDTYRNEQISAFCTQVEWAVSNNLPIIIHARAAHREIVDTLYNYRNKNLRGIFHCFGGTKEECEELLSFENFYLGIGGVLTFKKSTLPDVIKQVPLSRLVVETDAPYLAPVPNRGKRNESSFVYDTVVKLAEIKGVSVEEVADATSQNAEKLFF